MSATLPAASRAATVSAPKHAPTPASDPVLKWNRFLLRIQASIYGTDFAFTVTSPALPGVERSFVSFSEPADEASVSRIYNGNHTRIDQVAGGDLGHDIRRVRPPERPRPARRAHALTPWE